MKRLLRVSTVSFDNIIFKENLRYSLSDIKAFIDIKKNGLQIAYPFFL